jgi:hypothetical protein
VKSRFSRFRSKDYLEECIEKVLKFLDIYETGEVHEPSWMKDLYPERGGKGMSEQKLLRAQAVANLDIFFFLDPEKWTWQKKSRRKSSLPTTARASADPESSL